MPNTIELKVPDLGGSHDVPVIEILVQVGDTITKKQSLVTLESDKATMDVPASDGGKVTQVKVKIGQEVNPGDILAVVEVADTASTGNYAAASASAPAKPAAPSSAQPAAQGVPQQKTDPAQEPVKQSPAPQAASGTGRKADIECKVVVLGSGPGGYSAAFRAADLGLDTVLVERYEALGGVCLNVGCIPSKALLHAAAVIEEASAMAAHGITFGAPKIDLDKLRDFKVKVVGKLTGGLASM